MPTPPRDTRALPVHAKARKAAFSLLRSAHKTLAMKRLPDRLAIYFHALEPQDRDAFRACIEHFQGAGYCMVGADALVGDATPGRRLFVSFDDNYRNWHENLDLFADLGLHATFYVNSAPFMDTSSAADRDAYFRRLAYDGPPFTLTTGELRDLVQAGHAIGCHSHNHHNLAQLPPDRWKPEILDSRTRLEDLLGRPVIHFAYPYGMRRYFSEGLRTYCRSIGFQTIASAIPGLQHGAPVDPGNIHRTRWNFSSTLAENVEDLRIDGRLFEAVTGRSAVG